MTSSISPNTAGPTAKFGLDRYAGMRVVVLGASGFIGRWVARELSMSGAQLFLVVRSQQAAEPVFAEYGIRGEIVETDLSRTTAVRRLFAEISPQVTFNLAGYGVDRSERDDAEAYRLNAQLPAEVSEYLADSSRDSWPGQRLVHAGSALEYGAIRGDLSEDSAPRPTTLYGETKLAGSMLLSSSCRARGIRGVIARLFTVYGPGEHPGRLLPSLVQAAATGEDLPLTQGRQRRDFTYVEDTAEGLLRLGLSDIQPGEVVNLATGRLTSVRAFVETAAAVLGIPARRLRFGELPTRQEEMEHSKVSVARLQRATGWLPSTSIVEGVRRTAEFTGRAPIREDAHGKESGPA